MITDELREAFHHHLSTGGYISGRRAACALEMAKADLAMRRLIDSGAMRIEVRADDQPWDGDMPYDGPLYLLYVHLHDDCGVLGGIATDESDVCTYYDPAGLQATDDFGGYSDQCTIVGYLRTCAVEVATGLPGFDAAVAYLDDHAARRADAIWNKGVAR